MALANGGSKGYMPTISIEQNQFQLKWALDNLSRPKVDVQSLDAIKKRTAEYFDRCGNEAVRPSRIGWINYLGVGKAVVTGWKTGNRGKDYADFVRAIDGVFEELITTWLQDGHIFPPTAMFLLKSQYGYTENPKIEAEERQTVVTEQSIDEIIALADRDEQKAKWDEMIADIEGVEEEEYSPSPEALAEMKPMINIPHKIEKKVYEITEANYEDVTNPTESVRTEVVEEQVPFAHNSKIDELKDGPDKPKPKKKTPKKKKEPSLEEQRNPDQYVYINPDDFLPKD